MSYKDENSVLRAIIAQMAKKQAVLLNDDKATVEALSDDGFFGVLMDLLNVQEYRRGGRGYRLLAVICSGTFLMLALTGFSVYTMSQQTAIARAQLRISIENNVRERALFDAHLQQDRRKNLESRNAPGTIQ